MPADPGFAVYIHWPFCRSKCPYCDFNSHAGVPVDENRWRAALLLELAHFAAMAPDRKVGSVFFGGGTPSLMDPATVDAVIEGIRRSWKTDGDLEITLEANPTSAEAGRFRDFRGAGVNRLSLGVQALDDQALAQLGRTHDVAQALAALALAARVFPRFSFDLIHGRPGQTVEDWRRELVRAADLGASHLSAYQLSVEPGTPFHEAGVGEADEETAAALYETTLDVLEGAGLAAYEISNHARPGAECRHNLATWRGGDYVGIGPGAHGRLTLSGHTHAVHQIRSPDKWLSGVETAGHGTAGQIALTAEERREEILMLGLRLTEGVNRDRFRALTGVDVKVAVDGNELGKLVDSGFLVIDQAALRATPAGRSRLNAVLARLLA